MAKNIQTIDGSRNNAYWIWRISDKAFKLIFPAPGQTIEFIEDVKARLTREEFLEAFDGIWDRAVHKSEVQGIHGTLFYECEYRKADYPTKVDEEQVNPDTGGPHRHMKWVNDNPVDE